MDMLYADLNNIILPESLCKTESSIDCLTSSNSTQPLDYWIPNGIFDFEDTLDLCVNRTEYLWMVEHKYAVAITLSILGVIGLTGNLLSCVIIATSLLKISGTFVFFLFLSIADSLVVVMQIIEAYRNSAQVEKYTEISPEEYLNPTAIWRYDWSCKLFQFFWHFSLQFSAWIVMTLSVERYVSLRRLFHGRPRMYRRATMIVCGILLFLVTCNIPFLVYSGTKVTEMSCKLYRLCFYVKPGDVSSPYELESNWNANSPVLDGPQHVFAKHISTWLSRQHLIIYGLIPYTVTLVFNIILIRYLRSSPQPTAFYHESRSLGSGPCIRNKRKTNNNSQICCKQCTTGRADCSLNTNLSRQSHIPQNPPELFPLKRQGNTESSVELHFNIIGGTPENILLDTAESRSVCEAHNGFDQMSDKSKQLVCNHKSCTNKLKRSQMSVSFQDDSGRNFNRRSISNTGWWIGQARTTVLLLVVTFAFIGLSIPHLIFSHLREYHQLGRTGITNFRTAHAIEEICRFLLFANNSLNFLFYMSGRQFRKGLIKLTHQLKRHFFTCDFGRNEFKENQWYRNHPKRKRKLKCVPVAHGKPMASRIALRDMPCRLTR